MGGHDYPYSYKIKLIFISESEFILLLKSGSVIEGKFWNLFVVVKRAYWIPTELVHKWSLIETFLPYVPEKAVKCNKWRISCTDILL